MADFGTLVEKIATSRKERRERELTARARGAIDVVVRSLGVTRVELAVALGLGSPVAGSHGSCVLDHVYSGRQKPSDKVLVALELLAQGLVGLRQDGQISEKRRRFVPVVTLCPECLAREEVEPYHLSRRGLDDVCSKCGHRQPADTGVCAVDQDAIKQEEGE